ERQEGSRRSCALSANDRVEAWCFDPYFATGSSSIFLSPAPAGAALVSGVAWALMKLTEPLTVPAVTRAAPDPIWPLSLLPTGPWRLGVSDENSLVMLPLSVSTETCAFAFVGRESSIRPFTESSETV